MQLKYFTGNNFGDSLNPVVFNYFLPGFFDTDPSFLFLGIGSVLGFIKPEKKTQKMIVFSSGFAYDDIPKIDSRYDIRCVRGPLTAKSLQLDPSLSIADGALLLGRMETFKDVPEKKYKYSYIPHHNSLKLFDRWDEVLNPIGINYISPEQDPLLVIQQIRESECILAEAMHASIIADTFRVPWIPVKMFLHINQFKWQDWYLSMNLSEEYAPHALSRLYNLDFIEQIIFNKLRIKKGSVINTYFSNIYRYLQSNMLEKRFQKQLMKICHEKTLLSNNNVLESKQNQLLDILFKIKSDYS